uniref:Uncharacterized protein n=1 Tax=Anguilla anguilla TaxID=7936 RepID=A0A0E9UUG7_ANGAN
MTVFTHQVVGVADPRVFARQKLQEGHHIAEENVHDGSHASLFDSVFSPTSEFSKLVSKSDSL